MSILSFYPLNLNLDIMKIAANISNVSLTNIELTEKTRMVYLRDDYFVFDLQ